MNTEAKIEALKKEFEEKLNALKQEIKPEFEVGKWYKSTSKTTGFKWLLKFSNIDDDNKLKWAVCISQNQDYYTSHVFPDDMTTCQITPATPEEVKKALIAEAEKRGFKKMVTIKNINGVIGMIGKEFSYTDNTFYSDKSDLLSFMGAYVYKQGQWAEIVKDEVITICGKEVEFNKNGHKYCLIDNVEYSQTELLFIKQVIEKGQIKSLNVGCNGNTKVDLEFVNKIIDCLK